MPGLAASAPLNVASCPLSFQIAVNATNAQPLGQQLAAFTSRAAQFTDVMDVIFVTHLVERLTRLVEQRKDVRRLRVVSMDRVFRDCVPGDEPVP